MVEQSHLFNEIHEQPQVLSRLLEQPLDPLFLF